MPPPSTYSSTYKAYKQGTKKLVTWLIDNARRCGADLSFLLSTNPGGSATYQVAVKELTALARKIVTASEPKIRIPQSIITVTRTIISLRKGANQYFTKLTKSRNSYEAAKAAKAADAGHKHFISALEEILTILQPEHEAASRPADLPNMFAALTVEDVAAEDSTPTRMPNSKKQKQAESTPYELEENEMDYVFAIITFFKDINDIREHIMNVWRDYRNGKLNLMSAAVTTDTAFGVMKRSSGDLLEALPLGVAANYPSLVLLLSNYLESLGGNSDNFGDFVCARAYSLLASYADVLSPEYVQAMKYGHFGVYEPRGKDWFKQSTEQQHLDDLIVLMEVLPEFTKLSRGRLNVPAEDGLTSCLRIMMDASDLEAMPMHGIFATQVFLDIHHVLREDVSSAFEELKATGNRVIQTIDDYFRFSRSRSVSIWPAHNDQVFKEVQRYAKEWTQKDVLQDLGQALSKSFRQKGVRSKPYWLLSMHPVLAGLIVFRLNMMLHDGGISLCNAWGSVLYPAHLYNAARHSAGLQAGWTDMDYIISVHGAQRIFVGAAPTEPAEYHKRFLLALGGSASNFARNRRRGGPALIVESKKGPRGLKSTSPVRDIWLAHYLLGKPVALTTPNIVAMLSVASKAERTSVPSVNLQDFTREIVVQRQYTPLQLLQIVREGVAAEEFHLLFDYFGFHQRGLKLLRTLQTHLHADLVKYFTESYIEDESQLPYIIGYLFEVVRGSDRIAQALPQGVRGGSRMLHDASGVLEKFLQTDDNKRGGVMRARAMSNAVVYAYHAGTLGSVEFPAGLTRLDPPPSTA